MEIPMTNKNELLKWLTTFFLKNDFMDKELLIQLKEVYKPFSINQTAVELYTKVINKEIPEDMENMSYLVLCEVISLINKDNNQSIFEMLCEYHFKYNRPFIINIYRDLLLNNLNKKVYTVVKHPNENKLVDGKLEKIEEKESITIDEETIPFIGFKQYIVSIKDEDSNVLFLNNEELDPNLLTDDADIKDESIRLFGKQDSLRR